MNAINPLAAALPASPMVDASGNVTPAWRGFFMALQTRTGGGVGVSSGDASARIGVETSNRIAADNALGIALHNETVRAEAAEATEQAARIAADTDLAARTSGLGAPLQLEDLSHGGKRISELPAFGYDPFGTVLGSERLPVVQAGGTRAITLAQLYVLMLDWLDWIDANPFDVAAGSGAAGGNVALLAGQGDGGGQGGAFRGVAGNGGDTGDGGGVSIQAGDGGATSGFGGSVHIYGGNTTTGTAGNVIIQPGDGGTAGTPGQIVIASIDNPVNFVGPVTIATGRGYQGADVSLTGGNGVSAAGGNINITGGTAEATLQAGGGVNVVAGTGGDGGTGAGIFVNGGNGAPGGQLDLTGGNAGSGDHNGGDITLSPGALSGAGRDGLVIIDVSKLPGSDPGVSGALWADAVTHIVQVSP